MAINKKLIHFKTKENFNKEVAKGNILDTSIVFIQNTNEIYTHGTFYDCKTADLSAIETNIQNILKDVENISLKAGVEILEIEDSYLDSTDSISVGSGTFNRIKQAITNNKTIVCNILDDGIYSKSYVMNVIYDSDEEIQLSSYSYHKQTFGSNGGHYWVYFGIALLNSDELFCEEFSNRIPSKTSHLTNDSNFITESGIKTINGESILGSGDITIEVGNVQAVDATGSLDEIPSDVYVKYVAQTLTDAQKAQARSNIGVESFTQTQSDWSVTDSSSAAFIKNKPTIPTKVSQLTNDAGYLKAGSGDGTMFLSNDGTYKTVSTDVPIQKLTFGEYTELTLQPNIYYELSYGDIAPACSLVVNFASSSNTNVISQYVFQIDLTAVPGGATLTMPSVKWSNGIAPTFESAIYQISIINGLATWQKFVATNTGQ